MCKRHQSIPDKQKASAKELVVDNLMNNRSSNISKIFPDPKDRQVKHYYPNKEIVTLSIGSGLKEFLGVQRNQQSFF